MARAIAINGKFLSGAPGGVRRVAEALVGTLDRRLAATPTSTPWRLLLPKDAQAPRDMRRIEPRTVGQLTWQFWEQIDLPRYSRDALLVNLCNLAPLTRPGVTMIHDAQVFISPESYGAGFRRWYQFALPRIGARAERILTVSNYSRDRLIEYGVAPAEKISVIYNGVDHLANRGVDTSIVERLGLAGAPYVVAMANTQKHKNISLLLKAFSQPSLKTLKLVLIGSHGAADLAAAGAPPPPNAVFAGRISDEAMAGLMAQAVCLAFPSTTEGFGLPPLEAMQAGCPAVVAPCGALPEVCGDAALYAAADDPQAWAQAILSLVEDPGLRSSLIAKGRVQAMRFNWDDSADQLIGLLSKLAS